MDEGAVLQEESALHAHDGESPHVLAVVEQHLLQGRRGHGGVVREPRRGALLQLVQTRVHLPQRI